MIIIVRYKKKNDQRTITTNLLLQIYIKKRQRKAANVAKRVRKVTKSRYLVIIMLNIKLKG
jgi:hypothetical protein